MCLFFFSEDSHTKQITSPVIVPYMVTYGTEGDPSVLATRLHTHCNNAKLFAIAPGEKRTPHCIINHIYSSVIKVSEYIRLKTTECLGKGILC